MNDPIASPLPVDLSAILAGSTGVKARRRIYANRNLDMGRINVIGFDMDYTLAQYHQHAMDELSIRMTVQKLIENHGYPEEIREAKLDHAFIIRGLVVDKETGRVLKLDAHRLIGRCYHGYKIVDKAEWSQSYENGTIRLDSERYARIDTLFSLPETTLLSGIIEYYEADGGKLPWTYRKLFDDIRQSIDEAHRDNSLKADILENLSRYIVRDPDLAPTLHKLRSAGKQIFLLTNSEWYYTDAVMAYLLDGELPFYRSWRDYFDIIGVSAHKPSFFTESAPFLALDESGAVTGKAKTLRRGGIYQGGNSREFEEALRLSGDDVLYVGDHIYGDIVQSKKSAWWRTALVIQEMEESIELTQAHLKNLRRITHLEDGAQRLDDDINYHLTLLKSLGRIQQMVGSLTGPESRVIESAREQAKSKLDENRALLRQTLKELEELEARVDSKFNPYWGRVFRERNERSLFGYQVQSYADIYTSRVSNFLGYSPGQWFRAPREVMPHERG